MASSSGHKQRAKPRHDDMSEAALQDHLAARKQREELEQREIKEREKAALDNAGYATTAANTSAEHHAPTCPPHLQIGSEVSVLISKAAGAKVWWDAVVVGPWQLEPCSSLLAAGRATVEVELVDPPAELVESSGWEAVGELSASLGLISRRVDASADTVQPRKAAAQRAKKAEKHAEKRAAAKARAEAAAAEAKAKEEARAKGLPQKQRRSDQLLYRAISEIVKQHRLEFKTPCRWLTEADWVAELPVDEQMDVLEDSLVLGKVQNSYPLASPPSTAVSVVVDECWKESPTKWGRVLRDAIDRSGEFAENIAAMSNEHNTQVMKVPKGTTARQALRLARRKHPDKMILGLRTSQQQN